MGLTSCLDIYHVCSGIFIFIQHKCEQYWPEQDNPKKPEQENPKCYGDIQVTMVELEQFADFKIRTFILNRVSVL